MYKKIRIESRVANLRVVENAIDETTATIGISRIIMEKFWFLLWKLLIMQFYMEINLILRKLLILKLTLKVMSLNIKVTDEGPGFRPEKVPDPTTPENIEELNGRGIYLMSHLADKIEYSKKGNSVTMTFKNIMS